MANIRLKLNRIWNVVLLFNLIVRHFFAILVLSLIAIMREFMKSTYLHRNEVSVTILYKPNKMYQKLTLPN